MLEIKVIMNSSVEDVLGFKCCNLNGMNLEIIFHNHGHTAAAAPDCFTLENNTQSETVRTVYPPWPQIIAPGDSAALYCNMDEDCWKKYDTLMISEENGKQHRIAINRE